MNHSLCSVHYILSALKKVNNNTIQTLTVFIVCIGLTLTSQSTIAAPPDDDRDGIANKRDNCPLIANPDQADFDSDGIGDVCDDSDSDGVMDSTDVFPQDPTESIDTDADGIGNNADPDDDNDEMPDSFETTYGLNTLNAADAALDADTDSYDNLAEFRAGTNPTDATVNPGTVENLHYKLLASGAASNQFAGSVSVSGETALIGAPYDYDNGANSGAAFVYVRDTSNRWIQQSKLIATDGVRGNQFGASVSLSGNSALIGAIYNNDAGAAYVFVRDVSGVWSQQAKLTASDVATNAIFGGAVSLFVDTALVSAMYDNVNGYTSGSAYVFVRDAAGVWNQQAKLLPSDGAAEDVFGNSVSLYGDTALISAPTDDDNGTNSGSVYVFVQNAVGIWNQQAKLLASDGDAEDKFGRISLSGDTALIGATFDDNVNGIDAGSVYVFARDTSDVWTQQTKLTASDGMDGDLFGANVSLSGNHALVTAVGDDDKGPLSGSAYVYARDTNGNWSEQLKLIANDGASAHWFGLSASLSGDIALIGAPRDDDNGSLSGSAYLFNLFDNDAVPYSIDNCPLHDNPDQLDSDGDGVGDVCDDTNTNTNTDTDSDGLLDNEEDLNANGLVDAGETDPFNADTDNDGLNDGDEALSGTNPLDIYSPDAQGWNLSINSDFNDPDTIDSGRLLPVNDTLHMLIWSNTLDVANIKIANYKLKVGRKSYSGDLVNNLDGTYSGQLLLSATHTGNVTLEIGISESGGKNVAAYSSGAINLTVTP